MRNLLHSAVCVLVLTGGCATNHKNAQNTSATSLGISHCAAFGTNRVHYVTMGKGSKTIVFVHGWSCNESFWKEQEHELTNHAKLILIDLPGHGSSDKPQVDYTMDFFADAVLAVLRDAKVAKATLVGHSMGTPIICRVYARAPQQVTALVAVDGLLRRPKIPAGQAEKIVAPYRAPNYRDQVVRFVNSMFPNPGTETLRDWVLAEMLKTPQHVMSSAMEGMFNPGQPDWDPAKVDVPVLVINTKSPMWTADYEAYVGKLSTRTECRTIGGAGHFLMLEKPAEFNTDLSEMLAKYGLIR